MKKLHKLVLRSWLGPFILTFFIALFILLMQFLWKYIDDFVGKGLEWYIIAELMFFASASLVPMALPLAILLSSLMTFGNLGEHLELAACKSSGISLQRVMSPLIVTAVIVSMSAFYFSNYILPVCNLKMGTLLYDIQQQRPALNIKEGVFYAGIQGYIIKVKDKSEDGKVLHDVMIYDHVNRLGANKVIVADSGKMEMTTDENFLVLTLYNGYSYEEVQPKNRRENTYPHQRSHFKENAIRFDMSEFKLERHEEEIFKNNHQMLNVKQLADQRDTLVQKLKEQRHIMATGVMKSFIYFNTVNDTTQKRDTTTLALAENASNSNKTFNPDVLQNFPPETHRSLMENAANMARNNKVYVNSSAMGLDGRLRMIWRYEIEWHRKFTLSVACLVLFFIGAPLGAIIRKGGLGLPAVISVIFFVLYHSVSMIGEKFARQGGIEPGVGMWMASAFLLPIGVFLTYKATTDSVILDMGTYLKPFEKVINRVKLLTEKYISK